MRQPTSQQSAAASPLLLAGSAGLIVHAHDAFVSVDALIDFGGYRVWLQQDDPGDGRGPVRVMYPGDIRVARAMWATQQFAAMECR